VNLSEISIRRPVFAWMLMAALIIFGLISYKRLGISQLPDVDFPVVSVSLNLPGAAPEVVESQVLDPIEDAIMEIDGIRSVTSSATQSSGSISVEFELNRNIDRSMQEIQNKINQVQNLLPLNLFPPTLRKQNPEDSPILWLALSSEDPNTKPIDLMIYARNYLYDQFGMVPGVGNVVLGGYVDPALRIWADNNKLKRLNMTADDVTSAIAKEHVEIPAGRIENDKKEYFIRVLGEATSPAEFEKIPLMNRANQGPNYKPTTLGQVSSIEEGITDVRKKSRSNGRRAVGLGIIKQHGSNAVEVADEVKKKLKEIEPFINKPFRVDVRSDNTRFIKQSVSQLVFTLCLSALLTSIVCYLFLGSWTSTINVLMAIPTSIIGTFIAFFAFHFTLNTFTLLGLSLAIGIVVDDAIMMLENIVRHRELGEGKKQAAIKGAKEITFAALAATVAVVAIFLPVVFMPGVIGRFFLQYGITVTVAVLLSLLEALTLTPMRCSRYLIVDKNPKGLNRFVEKIFHRLASTYGAALAILLRHRIVTLSITLVLFIGSLYVAKLLPSEMMPAQDQSMMLLRFKLPVGTAIGVTDAKMKIIEDYLLTMKEVDSIFSAVGGFGGDAVNQGMAFVMLVDRDKRKLSQEQMIKKLRGEFKKKVPGMETVVQDLSLRGFAATRGFPVEFIVQGPNWEKLTAVTNDLMDKMRSDGFTTDVNTDVQSGMPEVQLTPNREKLAAHGISVQTVTNVINSLVGGSIINGDYQKGRHRYEVEMRLVSNQRNKIPDLDKIELRNNRGYTVKLSEVVDRTVKPSLMLISRLNRSRAITVYANAAPGHSQKEALQETQNLAKKILPPGYTFKMIGSSQSFQESFQALIVALMLGILVSYMVLASQFNSFIHPITVLMALPFSFSGAFIGLALGHQSINMYSLIGFILLMGIVKKNSILLVDFTNQVRDEGLNVHDALLKACPVRLRPILMTSVATIAAALPEALSLGPGSETTIPMAISIIGGVTASTILTLFVVPCVYSVLTRFEKPDPLDTSRRFSTNHGAPSPQDMPQLA
jgi:hydrophobe/amphiphile efflux-1 (HAE1) family protein